MNKKQMGAIRAFYNRRVQPTNEPETKLVAAFRRAINEPGFRPKKRPVGRPRKPNIERDFPELRPYIKQVEKKPCGRPRKRTEEELHSWLPDFDERKEKLRVQYNRRVTDKEVIESLVRECARAKGIESEDSALKRAKRKLVPSMQKRISDARRIRKSRRN